MMSVLVSNIVIGWVFRPQKAPELYFNLMIHCKLEYI